MTRSARRTTVSGFALADLLVLVAIVLALASVVQPFLIAVREGDRRKACMRNLNMLARGMESYCGDYGQYFPSWTAWGSGEGSEVDAEATHAMPVDYGWYSAMSGEKVHVRGVHGWNGVPVGLFRTIFAGSVTPAGDDGGKDIANAAYEARAPGHLNMVAHGIGCLLQWGYLGDARVFYCPSAEGGMPPDQGMGLEEDGSSKATAATSIEHLKRSGSLEDPRRMTHGDWTWLDVWQKSVFHGRAVQCDYNYRMVPAHVEEHGVPWAYLAGVRPSQRVYVGCPPFKTQKQLGGRVLISDSFSQNLFKDDPNAPDGARVLPGRAAYAHKDGYNVLYGDWHISWHADEEKRILLWPRPTPQRDKLDDDMAAARWQLGRNVIGRWTYDDGKLALSSSVGCSSDVWHIFDNAAGIDVARDDPDAGR